MTSGDIAKSEEAETRILAAISIAQIGGRLDGDAKNCFGWQVELANDFWNV
jgi:hypothetical protein